ncbi:MULTISPECIES: flagellar hook-associated protein FlgL [Bacillaceae]|uniref:Flagellar hook-associated protein FlgL n=1 Tax=Evansella alkalicola TaxID=745819 RepID=A0ABS6JT98_9BACI|nr:MULTISPECIES: flagellar hook-associated protein FlgL [Bacillaceae]MBU9721728.1 flagellar hook-associated protein FlgL [Bacillus alkalicola]
MRVTQSMLTQNSLGYLSQSFKTLQTLQDQLATGKKISRASQDPVVAMNGMRYRTQVTEVQQFNRNLSEVYNWMDNADATLDEATQAVQRVRELAVQAANDTYEETQRANIAKEVRQLREHLESLANTKSNNKYIFNGTNTTQAPVTSANFNVGFAGVAGELNGLPDGAIERGATAHVLTHNSERFVLAEKQGDQFTYQRVDPNTGELDPNKTITITAPGEDNQEILLNANGETEELQDRQVIVSMNNAVSTNGQTVNIELLKGVTIPVNIRPENVFSTDFFGDLIQLERALEDPNTSAEELTKMIGNMDRQMEKIVNERAELGARYNRVEMIDQRVQQQEVIARRTMSNNEDADIEKVITELLSAENIHRAALSSTSRILQPTLMDFLR